MDEIKIFVALLVFAGVAWWSGYNEGKKRK
jgi:hypothetical protein